jgi:CRISPR-associated exonuclease Cas4
MDLLPVTELRQWVYCPRVVYYHQIMPGVGQPTYKMKEALRAQDLIERLEMRRTLGEYSLEHAERLFGVWLTDQRLGISGKLDLLLRGDHTAAVVDFKLTSGEVGENHEMQLAAYAMLVESSYGIPSPLGFIFRIPDNRIIPVPITPTMIARVVEAISKIRSLQATGDFPEATSVRKRCKECEYANYCGDVW